MPERRQESGPLKNTMPLTVTGYRIDIEGVPDRTPMQAALWLLQSGLKAQLRQLVNRREWRTLHQTDLLPFQFDGPRSLVLKFERDLVVEPQGHWAVEIQADFFDPAPGGILDTYSSLVNAQGCFQIGVTVK